VADRSEDRTARSREAPLARLAGVTPPAPGWFQWALGQAPDRTSIAVDGANIEMLTWGERGRPGLLLVHGNGAHADWWSFIAPFLAADHRVVALSLSGAGGSDWRPAYSFDQAAREFRAVAEAGGLYEAPVPPVFIGHSLGGALVFRAATRHPDWMRAAILVDTGYGPPKMDEPGYVQKSFPDRHYDTLQEALAGFRLRPAQGCENLFAADHIARRSLVERDVEGHTVWKWCFDPDFWCKFDLSGFGGLFSDSAGRPLTVHLFGEQSAVFRGNPGDTLRLPDSVPAAAIPDAEHHVLIDQPLPLVAAIRSLLAAWLTA
jgi:pimeloyl-ACP methyl ester carboxylesterase